MGLLIEEAARASGGKPERAAEIIAELRLLIAQIHQSLLAEKANLSPAPGIGFSLSLKWGNEIKTITPLDWNWRETIPEIEDLITSIAVHIFGEFEE